MGACRALRGRRALESRGGGQYGTMMNSLAQSLGGQARGRQWGELPTVSWRIAPERAGGRRP